MDRKAFLKAMIAMPAIAGASRLLAFSKSNSMDTQKMPALFIGHGSPMNAIEQNEFVSGWQKTAAALPKPKAILCISAHWETRGTWVTAMPKPATIHDFGGFPKALFDVQYPAAGSPQLAAQTKAMVHHTEVGLDEKWGLDHGAWSVIKPMFPNADVPVIQMSLNYHQPPQYHYDLAKDLRALRRQGVLIIGSGNMVHNLGLVAWDKMNDDNFAFDWTVEAGQKMKQWINSGNHQELINFRKQGRAFDLAIPTAEHFLPLLYTLALQEKEDRVQLFNDKAVAGSLTMTSVKIG
ncbi:MAG: 4,5-DOPA dioxygenase extradiol [Chitinophagales bacterium]